MIGTVINGKYHIQAKIGEGGMGAVYLAEQLDVKGRPFRKVALKVLLPTHSESPAIRERLLREIQITASLESPRIVPVYDSGKTEEGSLYFTMKFIQGDTLKKILAHGPLTITRALDIAAQICEVLTEVHERPHPIVHRDLKPDNIFIEHPHGQDWVRIGDFGIAKSLHGEDLTDLTQMGLLGTPAYMAPEQWTGEGVDERTDLYALGVVLYEMVMGRRPFLSGDGQPLLRQQHLTASPPPLPAGVPVAVRSLVAQLLAKDPNERPANAKAVKQVLEQVINPPAPPPQVIKPLPPPPRSTKRRALMIVGILLGGAGGCTAGGTAHSGAIKVNYLTSTAAGCCCSATDSRKAPYDWGCEKGQGGERHGVGGSR